MSTACVKKYCPKENKRVINMFTFGKTKKSNKHLTKMVKESCKKTYCNPTCKNTAYELKSKIKDKLLLYVRKTISKKNNILKNGFYEKLSKKEVMDLKKQGAISGCYKGKL